MKSLEFLSKQITFDKNTVDDNTTVLIGFTGYGSVGTLVLNHLIETFNVRSIGYWGSLSWFHGKNIESPITIYETTLNNKKDNEKFILVASRIPIPVVGYNALPDVFWKVLCKEILSWNANRYIILGGLREEVRAAEDSSWVVYAPTRAYTKKYAIKRTFKDNLTIRGPISFFLTEGYAHAIPVLSVLSYCNSYEEDIDAAQICLKDLEAHLELDLKSKRLKLFDNSFLGSQIDTELDFASDYDSDYEDNDDDYDEDDYDDDFDDTSYTSFSKFFKDFNVEDSEDDYEKYK